MLWKNLNYDMGLEVSGQDTPAVLNTDVCRVLDCFVSAV